MIGTRIELGELSYRSWRDSSRFSVFQIILLLDWLSTELNVEGGPSNE